ncbi:MAG: hypothetical protein MZV64_11155 [Ignavibacteriales bacterium]|nr:hypothetical protein [Ignavibacteriales bacterium]
MASARERYGDNAEAAKPEGDHVFGRHKLGNPVFKIQDTQRFGNDARPVREVHPQPHRGLTVPMVDEDLLEPGRLGRRRGDLRALLAEPTARPGTRARSTGSRRASRSLGSLYKDSLFGMAHEFKAGLEFTDKGSASRSGYIHNFRITRNFVDPLIDLGEGLVVPPADYQYFEIGRANAAGPPGRSRPPGSSRTRSPRAASP